MDVNDDNLWDMSDDELEAAFKEAQADETSPDTTFEEDSDSLAEASITEDAAESDDFADEFSDGSEQSDEDASEDSDHEDSSEEGEDEADTEDSTTDAEDDISESDAENTSSDDAEAKPTEEQAVQSYKFKADGKDYEFTSQEIVEQFPKIFGQAMNYTKKMQAIKPWRKTIDAIESAELKHSDVSLMIDVLKGDKDAITEVLKRTGVDTLELDTEADSAYVAKDYGRDEATLAIEDVVQDIARDPEYTTTHNILSKEWDDRSWGVMRDNPEMIRLLHVDVKSGMYSTLQPIAEKLKVFDGGKKSDLDYYKEAAQEHANSLARTEALEATKQREQADAAAKAAELERLAAVKAQSEKRTATKQASAKRKAAAPTKAATAGRTVVDYLDDSEEAFEEWYKKLQDEM